MAQRTCLLLAFGTAICVWGACSSESEPGSGLPLELIGSDKLQVIDVLGEPTAEGVYDSTILDPAHHSEAEIESWLRSTASYEYVYTDFVVVFNAHDDVIKVTPRGE